MEATDDKEWAEMREKVAKYVPNLSRPDAWVILTRYSPTEAKWWKAPKKNLTGNLLKAHVYLRSEVDDANLDAERDEVIHVHDAVQMNWLPMIQGTQSDGERSVVSVLREGRKGYMP